MSCEVWGTSGTPKSTEQQATRTEDLGQNCVLEDPEKLLLVHITEAEMKNTEGGKIRNSENRTGAGLVVHTKTRLIIPAARMYEAACSSSQFSH